MMKSILTFRGVVASLVFVCLASMASASVTLDFADHADNGPDGERGYGSGDTITMSGGTQVTLYAWNTNAPVPLTNETLGGGAFSEGNSISGTGRQEDGPYPYLDSNNAGLGVGQILDTDGNGNLYQVTPSSDDNVTDGVGPTSAREVVGFSLGFDGAVTSLLFREAGHGLMSGSVDATFDSGSTWSTLNVVNGLVVGFTPQALLAGDIAAFAYNDEQFYVSAASVVPEASSAIVWTLGLAVGCICSNRLRKSGKLFIGNRGK